MTVIYAVTNELLLYVVMSTLLQLGISESLLELQQTPTYDHTAASRRWVSALTVKSGFDSAFWFWRSSLKSLQEAGVQLRHPLLYMTQWGSRGPCDTSMCWHAAHLICLHRPCIESYTYGQMQWAVRPPNDETHSHKDSALNLQSFILHLCLFIRNKSFCIANLSITILIDT